VHASRGSLKTVILLCVSAFGCFSAYPQTAEFMQLESASFHVATMPTAVRPCAGSFGASLPGMRNFPNGRDSEPFPCDLSAPVIPSVQPCNPSGLAGDGCRPLKDAVHANLDSGSRPGRKILQVRDRILEILQSENACTDWYRSKDADPASTFRTLSFEVDRKGPDFVVETREPGNTVVDRNPYVARVIQGEGSFATVTINANGAFFSTMAKVAQSAKEGGPLDFRGVHLLKVGPYSGNTLQAQVLTLLHEFGHLLELLPVDEGDRDGQSVQNSIEVLRYCRAEVESKARANTLLSSR
jgi:hypothetical protein